MNYNFMNRVIDKTGIVTNGQVPFTIIGTDYYIGFEDHVKKSIKDSIDNYIETTKIKPNFASLSKELESIFKEYLK